MLSKLEAIVFNIFLVLISGIAVYVFLLYMIIFLLIDDPSQLWSRATKRWEMFD